MKRYKILFFLSISLFMASRNTTSHATIITSPLEYNGHQYYLLSNSNWLDAENEAQFMGGHLVTINNAAEQDWIFNSFGGSNIALWIGLNDRVIEGQFTWVSGEPSAFTKWARGEPNNNANGEGEDCVHIWPTRYDNAGYWNDLKWDMTTFMRDGELVSLHGVVEVVPEPASLLLLSLGGLVLRRKK